MNTKQARRARKKANKEMGKMQLKAEQMEAFIMQVFLPISAQIVAQRPLDYPLTDLTMVPKPVQMAQHVRDLMTGFTAVFMSPAPNQIVEGHAEGN